MEINLHCSLTCQETGSCRGRELNQKGLRKQRWGWGGRGGGVTTKTLQSTWTAHTNSESPLQLTPSLGQNMWLQCAVHRLEEVIQSAPQKGALQNLISPSIFWVWVWGFGGGGLPGIGRVGVDSRRRLVSLR